MTHMDPSVIGRTPPADVAATRYSDRFTDVRGTVRNVAVSPDEIVVLGTPPQDEDEQTGHNCDAMGCGSVGDHVLYRAAIATPPHPAAVAEADVERAARAVLAECTDHADSTCGVLAREIARQYAIDAAPRRDGGRPMSRRLCDVCLSVRCDCYTARAFPRTLADIERDEAAARARQAIACRALQDATEAAHGAAVAAARKAALDPARRANGFAAATRARKARRAPLLERACAHCGGPMLARDPRQTFCVWRCYRAAQRARMTA